jgi:hypothetical protein
MLSALLKRGDPPIGPSGSPNLVIPQAQHQPRETSPLIGRSRGSNFTPWQEQQMHLDWESLEDLARKTQIRSSSGNELVRPGLPASVQRSANGDLELLFTSTSSPPLRTGDRPGSVTLVDNEILLEGFGGLRGVARNATFRSTKTTMTESGEAVVEAFRPGEIELRFEPAAEVTTVIDWFENLDGRGAHFFGDRSLRTTSERVEIKFGSDVQEHALSAGASGTSTSYSALRLDLAGFSAWIEGLSSVDGVMRPGRIVYAADVPAETRRKVREVLSFALGNCLLHRGSTGLDHEGHVVWTSAVSSNPFGSRIFAIHAQPPAPMGANSQLIEQERLQPIVQALFNHYDELGFRALTWAYWHAVCAPIHIAAVHFGGAVEGLQASYMRANPEAVARNLVAPDAWRSLNRTLKAAIRDCGDLEDGQASMLSNKVDGLNFASGGEVFRRFMEALNLNQGGADVGAWRRRHQAAHGHAASPEDTVGIVRDTKLLRTLLNRIVLRIADASPTYVDQFTLGFPVRPIAEGVPSEGGDA